MGRESSTRRKSCQSSSEERAEAGGLLRKELVFLEQNPELPFNASDSRQPLRPLIKKSQKRLFFISLVKRTKNSKCVSILEGSADLRTDVSPDSENMKRLNRLGSKAKLFERGANPRKAPSSAYFFLFSKEKSKQKRKDNFSFFFKLQVLYKGIYFSLPKKL